MHTYAKNIDITDIGYIKKCVRECLQGKWRKRKVIRFISTFENIPKTQTEELLAIYNSNKFEFFINHVSNIIRENIINRTIKIEPIKFMERYDSNSGKVREIGVESMMQQCYEYVAVEACMEMFRNKIGVYQCASIPKKGQLYGKKAISKWLKEDERGTRYFVKLDVKKCYPSIKQSLIKKYLHRDIKNKDLLYLLDTLIDTFTKGGLSIGSHLSQWLCNYYLSYAYHYMEQELFVTKSNGKKYRMISHQLFYMDDILMTGSNKKYLRAAVEQVIKYFEENLGLTIKPKWGINKVRYTDKNGKVHGCFIDMMGFKIYRDHTTIRKSIYKKIRRKSNRVRKKIKNHICISLKDAYQVVSYNGWAVNTNSIKMKDSLEMKLCNEKCREVISNTAKVKAKNDLCHKLEIIGTKGGYYERILQDLCSA